MKKLFRLLVFSFFLLIPLQHLRAQNTPIASQISVVSYEELVAAIRETRAQSRQRVEQAVEQEKVREAWETGKLIDAHVLQHKERAEYGKQVIERLAKDLGTSPTELYYMLGFARTYPIHQPADELSWAHYIELLSLNDDQERKEVATRAVNQHWTRNQVREEVRRRQASRKQTQQEMPVPTLTAQPGKLYTYRIVKAEEGPYKGQLAVDLGFANYLMLPFDFAQGDKSIKEGDKVLFEKGKLKKVEATEQDLWTYQAYVTKVIDGDTFDAVIDLGFKFTTFQKLRLRGLDAREIESAEGMEAKKFLEKRLKDSPVLIRTAKSDKYDRYLVDVFIKGKYVNQELIEAGLAERVNP